MAHDKKAYLREYARQHREEDKERHKKYYSKNKEKVKSRHVKTQKKTSVWFKEYKSTLECEECGFSQSAAIDFHHIDPNSKKFNISRIGSKTKETILEEIKKCKVLCANCHRILHYNEE